jgi:hypothetical protein
MKRRRIITTAAICLMMQALTTVAAAQNQDRCRFFCQPQIEIAPTLTINNLVFPARVAELPDGVPQRQTRATEFEFVIGVDIPTRFSRLDFSIEAHWTPFSKTDANPFTGRTAGDLGASAIRDNPVELEFETQFTLITGDQTGGWLAMHFDVVDNYSAAQRPTDRSTYTHKLDFEFDTAVSIFNRLPQKRKWLRNIEVEGSIDYMATGLPKKGDMVGGSTYFGDASRWSFSVAFVVPVAPW